MAGTLSHKDHFGALLRGAGFKATPGRLALLRELARGKPLNFLEATCALRGMLDQTTVFRALEALSVAGIVKRVRLEPGQTHYELLAGARHHHHLVCERCGRVEDVEACDAHALERQVLHRSKGFASVRAHSLEFFGLCRRCA